MVTSPADRRLTEQLGQVVTDFNLMQKGQTTSEMDSDGKQTQLARAHDAQSSMPLNKQFRQQSVAEISGTDAQS